MTTDIFLTQDFFPDSYYDDAWWGAHGLTVNDDDAFVRYDWQDDPEDVDWAHPASVTIHGREIDAYRIYDQHGDLVAEQAEVDQTLDPNTALYQKMAEEQRAYRASLLHLPSSEVLRHTYEYIVRQDILMAMENTELSPEQANALLASPTPLADIYHYFYEMDITLMDALQDSIAERADHLIAMQEQTRRTVVYKHDADYAKAHGELEQSRDSLSANFQCSFALWKVLTEHYDGHHFDPKAIQTVLQTFGPERVMLVLATTVRSPVRAWQGYGPKEVTPEMVYTPEMKQWAKNIRGDLEDNVFHVCSVSDTYQDVALISRLILQVQDMVQQVENRAGAMPQFTREETEALNTALCQKMADEQRQYRSSLLHFTPSEILGSFAYEYTVREDILMAMENTELSPEQANALLASSTPLVDVYRHFDKQDITLMDALQNSIVGRADRVLQMQAQYQVDQGERAQAGRTDAPAKPRQEQEAHKAAPARQEQAASTSARAKRRQMER